ncbi:MULTISPECIES: tetratricopeptide repeat protein [Burkholderia]|uniref:Pilus assembly protein n=2 Tax=Burkholderia cepacia complex TaxID=87882 RepID=A0AAW3Q5J0_9BURK|nr:MULTISPECIES: tetratricopeptide repeat protein [Burkholderia]KWH50034.1 pilus assembly protein [Burkholderia anthina]KWZ37028.1 pilus assembly protein [Burkholderia anthina]MCA7969293.1 tetratricopeptide repeat protein [Burkholderia sp. AU39826]MCA8036466.1 tetratricopeptide repeat protein [Burkholderia arboris]MDF3091911.1 tetratricopeptide repeat protein [Burkholderia semiarida]
MKRIGEAVTRAGMLAAALLLGACATKESGYGVGAQTERAALMQAADQKQSVPDTPGMYLGLIQRMQAQGLYYASLAHIDAYDKTYGVMPESILLRADALRMTDQPAASAAVYGQLLKTPLAARGYRGLGLLAGAAGDFDRAVQALTQASELAPTDPSLLSDLAYAKLRSGDVVGARVPLMKAAELDQRNPKIVSNLVLYLFAAGRAQDAQRLMNQQHLPPEIRKDINGDAAKIAAAVRAQQRAIATPPVVSRPGATTAITPMANNFGYDQTVPLLQRFAQ